MCSSFVAVVVKLTNRRRGKTSTVTCGRIYCTIHDSLGALGISSQTVIAQGND
jgi:hypothetical protein